MIAETTVSRAAEYLGISKNLHGVVQLPSDVNLGASAHCQVAKLYMYSLKGDQG